MKIALIIAAIIAGLMLIMYLPWIVGGAAAVIFCFWNEWYVAGVIIGIFAIIAQIIVGGAVWDDPSWKSSSSSRSGDSSGFGLPEMFVAYKFGEHNGKKNKDN